MSFFRYLAVQILAYAIDIGVFLGLTWAGLLGPILANATAKVAAAGFAFFSHKYFTFALPARVHTRRQGMRYAVLLAVNVPLASIVLSLFLLVIPHDLAAKVASDVVLVAFNYWASRTWIFASPRHNENEIGYRGMLPDLMNHPGNGRERALSRIARLEASCEGYRKCAPITRGPLLNGIGVLCLVPIVPLYLAWRLISRRFPDFGPREFDR